MTSSVESALNGLGLTLPEAIAPVANYVPYVRTGNLLFVSGQIPVGPAGIEFVGKLGADADIDFGRAAARLCAINLLAQVKAALGDLDKVTRVVRLGGFIACEPAFTDMAKVMNGASDLMVSVFGEKGRHARTTIGVSALPLDACVEVEGMFEVD